ncbi:pyrimidine dimer DNA glycosylase/endonuclease V [Nesterenkonia sp. HG001]|uniref:pyrimidine dimer DNA glycosylase/endonuclease V n=1 Tax=Nesterenkonia sp. HG001 TaxID=2983207 RepID=UPI002AC56CAC|nr:pyrimidine dimer DNA glycosylase/endonuclease V [Nesterenkonia sp. HG001]MDZ5078884.1 pyrimidine dimer DNA glycosylase/endonuclease V [Nesterenkonia sp. HG001]
MRLWSLHPSTLDRQGLIACWREALLAQAVLLGRTRGYTRHPQLERFRAHPHPTAAIGDYLAAMHEEALRRGYRFDAGRIAVPPAGDEASEGPGAVARIDVTLGQLDFEWAHLQAKLARRSPELVSPGWADSSGSPGSPTQAVPIHRLFRGVPGEIEPWERP